MRRVGFWVMGLAVLSTGCASGKVSSLLIERPARGPLEDVPRIGRGVAWVLEPGTQTQTSDNISVTVTHAAPEWQAQFFQNQDLFGKYAGKEPFFPEQLVFYVKVANGGQGRIAIDPDQFVLIDDRGNQYQTLSRDYLLEFASSRAGAQDTARSVVQDFRPGWWGISVPVGKMLTPKSRWRFTILERSMLKAGVMHPKTTYDGLIAFWTPVAETASLRLHVSGVKMRFDPGDEPKASLEFPFDFTPSAASGPAPSAP